MKNVYPFICLIFFLAGCKSETKTNKPEGPVAAMDLPADSGWIKVDSTKTDIPTKTFRGFYINGNEINTFRDCKTNQTYWVEDESGQLLSAYQKAKGHLSYSYESAITELKGYLKGKSDLGYASEYANVLVVTQVEDIRQKSFLTPCYEFEFIAMGNEPFWNVEIIPAENIIAVKDLSVEKSYVFPYRKPEVSENKISYEISNDRKESLKVILARENCNDGMSDRNYNYSALVTINGRNLSGCAIKKGDILQK